MEQEKEVFFTCPYCLEEISMILDGSRGGQEYIEDCEVCCRPIQVNYTVDEDWNFHVVAEPAQSNS